ncbi:MAG: AAA family ATPase [Candidatus Sumerlaeota bacterium]|nr:AAA family ATPase [Candidatus Sumerlaeota bacterium]
MIKTIIVKSFKSLESVEVELGQINVFIGANGSGKSNFLEAVGVLASAASGRVDDESLLRRGVRPGVPKIYKASFRNTRLQPEIRFSAKSQDAKYEVGLFNPIRQPSASWRYHAEKWIGNGKLIFDRSDYSKDKLNPEQGFAALKIVDLAKNNPAAILLNDLRNYSIYTPNTPILRGLVTDSQPREPVGLSGGGLPEAMKVFWAMRGDNIREVYRMIDWAVSFGVAPAASAQLSPSVAATKKIIRFKDRYMNEKNNIMTGYDASEGALYILFAAILAFHKMTPRFLAIDNFDHGLNPRLVRQLAECLCRWILDREFPQVLLTSHNPLILDGLPLQDDRVRLFTVDRSDKGRTIIQRVKITDNLIKKAAKGWTLSRLWVLGHLGGVPNNV